VSGLDVGTKQLQCLTAATTAAAASCTGGTITTHFSHVQLQAVALRGTVRNVTAVCNTKYYTSAWRSYREREKKQQFKALKKIKIFQIGKLIFFSKEMIVKGEKIFIVIRVIVEQIGHSRSLKI
jgi:hypothetical protein